MQPTFSIVVPVFNVGGELDRAISSVKNQTFADWELILVDDGSIDGSSVMVDQAAASDKRIRAVHKKNEGVVVARQRGYECSSGEWILFLDGDDELSRDCLSKLVNVISEYCVELIQFGYRCVQLDGRETESIPRVSGLEDRDLLLAGFKNSPLNDVGMCIWNKCYRRDIVKTTFMDVGDVRISHSEDGLFAFAALLHAAKLFFIPECLYVYILRANSALRRVNVKIVEEKELFLSRLYTLAVRSMCMNKDQISRMLEFHSYEACCYIFLMLQRNGAKWWEIKMVLSQLQHAKFFLLHNPQFNSLRRKVMRWLLHCPKIYWSITRLIAI